MLGELAGAVRGELGEMQWRGPRALQAAVACLAVGISVFLALALRLEDPWWAGITGYMCTLASQPQSFRKGALRIAGTVGGAALSYTIGPWVIYDPAATLLLLFLAGAVAVMGSLLSPHGYAWMLGGITTSMVTLGALDDPAQALPFAFYRTAEIVLGVAVALGVSWLLAPRDAGVAAEAPGWRSVLGPNWHVLSHGIRTGLAIAAVPVVWRVLELPNLSQMAISIGAVMAVPVLHGVPSLDRAAIARRIAERITGCALGGTIALLMLGLQLSQSFLPWMAMLMAGTWFSMQVQTGRHGISGVGAQASIVLILMMVQGWGPPAGLLPGVDRLAGMLGAIGMLVVVELLLGDPVREESLLF